MSSNRKSIGHGHPLGRALTQVDLDAVDGGTSEFHPTPQPPVGPAMPTGMQTHHFNVYGSVVIDAGHELAPPAGAASGAPLMPGAFGAPFAGAPVYGAAEACSDHTGIVTHTFDIKNWGDPHQNITIDGHDSGQIDTAPSIHDFEVFNDTIGGPTSVSTQTTNQDQSHLHESFNREVDMTNATWGLQAVANGDGQIGAVIHDAQGTHALGIGQSVREADGTVITNDGHSVVVNQALRDGGHADTSISLNGANYFDMETTGEGNVGLGGWAADHYAATGNAVQTESYVAAGAGVADAGLRWS